VDEFTPPTSKEPSIWGLIEMQRRLARSKNHFIQRMGTLVSAGVLDRRLSELTDRQLGQLMFEKVGRDSTVFEPELMICNQATQRLFRSANGALDDGASQPQHPPCPKCENEMLLHYGIEEPDFYECVSLTCGYKRAIEA
jgi:hypothetical protein